MKQRPIIFQGAMVRALLAGTKTQTRRIVKPQPQMITDNRAMLWEGDPVALMRLLEQSGRMSPYGELGDQLWVRESHWYFKDGHDPVTGYFPPALKLDDFEYRADGESDRHGWFPSIHMPRIGSRITLEITGVRVERLKDISEADALSEGVDMDKMVTMPMFPGSPLTVSMKPRNAIEAYAVLWESINGPGSWHANPWVWVVEFKRVSSA